MASSNTQGNGERRRDRQERKERQTLAKCSKHFNQLIVHLWFFYQNNKNSSCWNTLIDHDAQLLSENKILFFFYCISTGKKARNKQRNNKQRFQSKLTPHKRFMSLLNELFLLLLFPKLLTSLSFSSFLFPPLSQHVFRRERERTDVWQMRSMRAQVAARFVNFYHKRKEKKAKMDFYYLFISIVTHWVIDIVYSMKYGNWGLHAFNVVAAAFFSQRDLLCCLLYCWT